jgi:hypothetical protein
VRASERFAEPGELPVEAIFERAVGIGHRQVINRVLDQSGPWLVKQILANS